MRIVITSLMIIGGLGWMIAGCSSSRESAPAASSAAADVSDTVAAGPQVHAILEQSCYSCHSSHGNAPWYAVMAPTYLAAGSARSVLNFSEWRTYGAEKQKAELKSIERSVSAGSMPPRDFSVLDHSARLNDYDKQALLSWAAQRSATH